MMQVIFKNLERSELAIEAVTERLRSAIDRFPDLPGSHISVTLEMHNSPLQAGPDLFTVALHIKSGRYRGIRLTKSASNLYVALADIVEHLLEKLNRFGDRSRVKLRNQARGLQAIIPDSTTANAQENLELENIDQEYSDLA